MYYSYAATTSAPSNCSFDSKEKLWHCIQGQHIGRGTTIERAQRALHQSLTKGTHSHTLANIHRDQRKQTLSPSRLITHHPHTHPLPQPQQHPIATHAIKNIVSKGQLPPTITSDVQPNATPSKLHPNVKPNVTHDTTSLSLPPESKTLVDPALQNQGLVTDLDSGATSAPPPAPPAQLPSGSQDFSKNALSGGGDPVDVAATAPAPASTTAPAPSADTTEQPKDNTELILIGAAFIGLIALLYIL